MSITARPPHPSLRKAVLTIMKWLGLSQITHLDGNTIVSSATSELTCPVRWEGTEIPRASHPHTIVSGVDGLHTRRIWVPVSS